MALQDTHLIKSFLRGRWAAAARTREVFLPHCEESSILSRRQSRCVETICSAGRRSLFLCFGERSSRHAYLCLSRILLRCTKQQRTCNAAGPLPAWIPILRFPFRSTKDGQASAQWHVRCARSARLQAPAVLPNRAGSPSPASTQARGRAISQGGDQGEPEPLPKSSDTPRSTRPSG